MQQCRQQRVLTRLRALAMPASPAIHVRASTLLTIVAVRELDVAVLGCVCFGMVVKS